MGEKMDIQERTGNFAVRVIRAYVELSKRNYDDAGKVLAKQFLRSGTSIGANCAEATYAQSRNDLISKYSIAIKEASETQYWIKIMINAQLVSQKRFTAMQDELTTIIKILTTIINKLKSNYP
ncbi:MAG: four helix bundle protein [Roseofilum sp. SBFL]|uniref:four helix bundle protein n=1 Tax=unclassified Roseofilum TaxID=2620099 RepID=UPI001B0B6AF1|nr:MULTISPECIES: four helix bundle protein [unclassified Roseofilum]MBP0015878.1 four helix bundle protein [Roseofilum sp. SID3]MBP0025901.1 four helix bundle protein [Roseofilum sp. SID2]MBP0038177.1 four helix bundle protein [Roseofilum sp. SID1]MBP0040701.1 four helix bundle protein [Roseofilum sp. SBFL]